MLTTNLTHLTEDERLLWQEAYSIVLEQTEDEGLATLAAWGAVSKRKVVRATKSAGGGVRIVGWAMRFSTAQDKDRQNSYFNENTKTLLEHYTDAPLWMEHGLDARYGVAPIGIRVNTRVFPYGVVLEHELYADHPLYAETLAGVENGEFVYSSDSMSQFVRQRRDGHLSAWFLSGCSLTRDPAEPALGAVALTDVVNAVKSSMTMTQGAQQMNPLELLAKFFGVEATADAVKTAGVALVEKMQDDAQKSSVDMAALASALGLAPEAAASEIAARLQEVLNSMSDMATASAGVSPAAPAAPAAPTKGMNYNALAQVVGYLAANAPAKDDGIPYQVAPNAQPGVKSLRHNGAPAIVGKARVPGLADVVKAHIEGKGENAIKSMGYSIGPNGGYTLRQEVSSEMIELFRANAVIMQLGATFVPMTGIETLTYRKQLTGTTANYRGEGKTITQTEPTFGTVTLNLKELVGATRINRRLLRNSVENLESLIRNDLQKSLELRSDLAALRGTGGISDANSTGSEPRGIRNTTGVTATSLGANGAVPTVKNFIDMWGRVEDANVPASDSWGLAMAPRTRRFMENLTDTTGGTTIDVARWTSGYKYLTTTNIPINLTVGSSSDCSEVYGGDWQYLIVGVGQDIEFVIDESVYRTTGEIYIEATMMHDCAVAQPAAFQVLTGVRA